MQLDQAIYFLGCAEYERRDREIRIEELAKVTVDQQKQIADLQHENDLKDKRVRDLEKKVVKAKPKSLRRAETK